MKDFNTVIRDIHPDLYYTIAEISKAFGVCRDAVYKRLQKNKDIQPITIHNTYHIKGSDVLKLMGFEVAA